MHGSFSVPMPFMSVGVEDDCHGSPNLTHIIPILAGRHTGQGHSAYGHRTP